MNEKAELLDFLVSCVKTKIQSFVGFQEESISFVPVVDEDVKVVDCSIYLGNKIHQNISCKSEVLKKYGWTGAITDSLDMSVWHCQCLCRVTKVQVFRTLVIPVQLYSYETRTLPGALRRHLNSFRTRTFHRLIRLSLVSFHIQPTTPLKIWDVFCYLHGSGKLALIVWPCSNFWSGPCFLCSLHWGPNWVDDSCWSTTCHMITTDEEVSHGDEDWLGHCLIGHPGRHKVTPTNDECSMLCTGTCPHTDLWNKNGKITPAWNFY